MTHPLAVPLLLAMMSIAGLVAMFVLDGGWDGLFFLLSLAPLVAGCALLLKHRGQCR